MTQDNATPTDKRDLRDEFNTLNFSLRRHNDGDDQMSDEVYRARLRRSIDILNSLTDNVNNTATKKPATKKLAELKRNPDSLDDL